jgi:hypothetical protein
VTEKKLQRKPLVVAPTGPNDCDAALAQTLLRPTVNAALAVDAMHAKDFPDLDVNELIAELQGQARGVQDGNLARVEAMLVAQATTLDVLFMKLLRRALAQDTLPQYEAHMKFALKAQAQARATAEALAEIKNPKSVAFVQQANVGTNVQVNNTGAQRGPSRGESGSEQNEQLIERRGTLPVGWSGLPGVGDEVAVGGAGDERAGQD